MGEVAKADNELLHLPLFSPTAFALDPAPDAPKADMILPRTDTLALSPSFGLDGDLPSSFGSIMCLTPMDRTDSVST
jgi:hypothetical protein